nr:hypothetical protein [Tanacetum cinerariifolium]
ISSPIPEDLAAGTPSSKILDKAEASQKRKASTFGVASSHVAKRTRSALAQSFGSTTRPRLFAGDDDESDDDDACMEISLVTPLYSQGKGIIVDDAAAPSGGVSIKRPFSGPAPSFRDVSGDSIHTNFFSFSAGLYNATYPEDGVAGNPSAIGATELPPWFPDEGITAAKQRGVTNGISMQASSSSSLSSSSPANNLGRVIFEYATKPLLVILQLEPEKLVHPAIIPIPKDTRVSPPITKESTVTLVSKSLELSVNVVPASFVIALEHVSAAIDGSNLEMTDGATHSMSRCVFMRGTSHVLNDVAEVTVVGSERVSSGLSDVVVALSAGEKGDGSTPSSIVEEVVVPPSRV